MTAALQAMGVEMVYIVELSARVYIQPISSVLHHLLPCKLHFLWHKCQVDQEDNRYSHSNAVENFLIVSVVSSSTLWALDISMEIAFHPEAAARSVSTDHFISYYP